MLQQLITEWCMVKMKQNYSVVNV